MRVFFATGEASGDMMAAALADAMRAQDPTIELSGIGGERMRAAGVKIVQDIRGWAGMGPVQAIGKIPMFFGVLCRVGSLLLRSPVDLIVLIDFGAFNLRFAQTLRRLGYRKPMIYAFPPGAWLDKADKATSLARVAHPLTPFEHQRDFYRSLGLEIAYFGHPLGSTIAPRAPVPPAPPDGGHVALLPGSRTGELEYHLPVMMRAARLIRARRPRVRFVFAAASDETDALVRAAIANGEPGEFEIVRGARTALVSADVALVASGTAVLEAALLGVPAVAIYIVSETHARIGRRIYTGRYITLPNMLLDREIVPELLQEAATPEAVAETILRLLSANVDQHADYELLRERLGEPDALERWADYALRIARAG